MNFTMLWNQLFKNSQECIFKFLLHNCIIWCNKSMISWYFTMLCNIKFMNLQEYSWIILFALMHYMCNNRMILCNFTMLWNQRAGKILLVIAKHDEITKSNRNYQEDKLMMEFLRNDHQPTHPHTRQVHEMLSHLKT